MKMQRIISLKAYLKFEVFQRTILRFFSELLRPNGASQLGYKNKNKKQKQKGFSKSVCDAYVTVLCIKVYSFGMEMGQRIHFDIKFHLNATILRKWQKVLFLVRRKLKKYVRIILESHVKTQLEERFCFQIF